MERDDHVSPEFLALPDEIKVMILKYTLPSGLTLTAGTFNKKPLSISDKGYFDFAEESYELNKKVQKDFETTVVPALVAILAIKNIVYEVLYETNKVCIARPDANAFWYPPASINKWVRRVVLRTETDDSGLAFLRRFASGAFGFPNLLEVDIELKGWGESDVDDEAWVSVGEKYKAMAPIKLTMKKMTVSYRHVGRQVYHDWSSRIDVTVRLFRDGWVMVVLGKMLLEDGKEDKTRWERYWGRDWESMNDEEFPETEDFDLYGYPDIDDQTPRKTVKIMEV
jgi:hypothetical protein